MRRGIVAGVAHRVCFDALGSEYRNRGSLVDTTKEEELFERVDVSELSRSDFFAMGRYHVYGGKKDESD